MSHIKLVNIKMTDKEELGSTLTDSEQKQAIRYYGYGWSYQEIVERILALRNEGLRRLLLRAVGAVISEHYETQAYPVEFYGEVEEE